MVENTQMVESLFEKIIETLYNEFITDFFFWLVENENHCDFVKLRDLLLSTNMEDLKDQTHTQHYECYRSNRLQKLGFSDMGPDNRPVR